MREAASFIASQSGSPTAGLIGNVLKAAYDFFHAYQRRRAVASLVDFDDHVLADIGLTRNDVREALEQPFSNDLGRELHYRADRNHRRGWNR